MGLMKRGRGCTETEYWPLRERIEEEKTVSTCGQVKLIWKVPNMDAIQSGRKGDQKNPTARRAAKTFGTKRKHRE